MKIASLFIALGLCLSALYSSPPQRQPAQAAVELAAPVRDSLVLQGAQASKKADQEPPARGQTQISVSVDLVNLQVLVTDKKGNILTGLKPEHFTVYEDNVKQEVTHFSPVEASITVVLLVDFSKMVEWFIYDVWEAIYGFAESLRKGDWVAVIGYDLRPTILTDFTQNRSELMEALRRFNTPAFRESNLSDAVIYTLDRVEEIEGKVAVLLVSTGLDTFSRATYDEALKKTKSANASVYSIGVGQSVRLRYNLDNIEWLMADNRLRTFAEFTGGEAFFPRFPTEFPSIFKNISNMLRNQYSLAYASSNPKKDGKFRKIRVTVAADVDELKIMTRSGYQAREK
jgi:VWFA-related protein